ncbi:hypothetical protein PS710_01552 [Pseudomonas fluorescens]|uniref:Uncharacterized protein n=1 Tax=Pseudomonas fluorescens TaxID=294 RepID=A0A5E7B773_PSEFL|nr:hypothetical protein PS710_01552 [Pseudomonas fluorescens]
MSRCWNTAQDFIFFYNRCRFINNRTTTVKRLYAWFVFLEEFVDIFKDHPCTYHLQIDSSSLLHHTFPAVFHAGLKLSHVVYDILLRYQAHRPYINIIHP